MLTDLLHPETGDRSEAQRRPSRIRALSDTLFVTRSDEFKLVRSARTRSSSPPLMQSVPTTVLSVVNERSESIDDIMKVSAGA